MNTIMASAALEMVEFIDVHTGAATRQIGLRADLRWDSSSETRHHSYPVISPCDLQ
jgi:hypothetical protein